MKQRQVIVRMPEAEKKAFHLHADLEDKSVTQYVRDIHKEHVERKRSNKGEIDCPKCKMGNARAKIICDNCGHKY